ncbi:hypothetical protein ACFZBE_40620 [Streptomyces sp. NPDC008061]|uniref:hypothetical protein n=1 Tax=Streptomyces sp. NPDC008061 TaxID=3364805 RepID=UPI0036E9A0B2
MSTLPSNREMQTCFPVQKDLEERGLQEQESVEYVQRLLAETYRQALATAGRPRSEVKPLSREIDLYHTFNLRLAQESERGATTRRHLSDDEIASLHEQAQLDFGARLPRDTPQLASALVDIYLLRGLSGLPGGGSFDWLKKKKKTPEAPTANQSGPSGISHRNAYFQDLIRIRYAEAAAAFDARLGQYLIQRPQALEAVREAVLAIADLLEVYAPERLPRMGRISQSPKSGDIGTGVKTIKEAIASGNLRELVGLLFNVVSRDLLDRLLVPPDYDDWLAKERKQRREVNAPASKISVGDIIPPLSQREIAAGVFQSDEQGNSYVMWARAVDLFDLPFSAPLHTTSERTGGLVAAGSSGSILLILESLHRLQPAAHREFNFPEIRLGLIGAMLVGGHHTAHELMSSSAKWPLAGRYGFGGYTDGWMRYRHLWPVTQDDLRRHVAVGQLFPDEIAAGALFPDGTANPQKPDSSSTTTASSGMETLQALRIEPERWASELDRDQYGAPLPSWNQNSRHAPATRIAVWSDFVYAQRNLAIALESEYQLRRNGQDPRTGQARPNDAGRDWASSITSLQVASAGYESALVDIRAAGLDPDELGERFRRWSVAALRPRRGQKKVTDSAPAKTTVGMALVDTAETDALKKQALETRLGKSLPGAERARLEAVLATYNAPDQQPAPGGTSPGRTAEGAGFTGTVDSTHPVRSGPAPSRQQEKDSLVAFLGAPRSNDAQADAPAETVGVSGKAADHSEGSTGPAVALPSTDAEPREHVPGLLLEGLPSRWARRALEIYSGLRGAAIVLNEEGRGEYQSYWADVADVAASGMAVAEVAYPGFAEADADRVMGLRARDLAERYWQSVGTNRDSDPRDIARYWELTHDSSAFRRDLKVWVDMEARKAGEGVLSHAEVTAAWQRLPGPQRQLPLSQLSRAIFVAHRGGTPGLRAGGGGFQAELPESVHLDPVHGLARSHGSSVLASGDGFRVEIERKTLYLRKGKLYQQRQDAKKANWLSKAINPVTTVETAVLKFVTENQGVLQHEMLKDERAAFAAWAGLEKRLAARDPRAGRPIALEDAFPPADGWTLTELARGGAITRARGEHPVLVLHHTMGVPVRGLRPFLQHISDHTYLDPSHTTRLHLSHGLGLGDRMAALSAQRQVPHPDTAALGGYISLLYTQFAALVEGWIDAGPSKAVVLSRTDLRPILDSLPESVHSFFAAEEEMVTAAMEAELRITIPDFAERYKKLHGRARELPESLFDLPLAESRDLTKLREYVLAALVPPQLRLQGRAVGYVAQSHAFDIPSSFELDARNGNASDPLVVLEVRHYGEAFPTVEKAAAAYRRLKEAAVAAYKRSAALAPLDPDAAFWVDEPADSTQVVHELKELLRKTINKTTNGEGSWGEFFSAVDALRPQYRRWLGQQEKHMDELFKGLAPFRGNLPGQLAARLMIHADPRCEEPATARETAVQQLTPILRLPTIAQKLLSIGSIIAIVPNSIALGSVVPGKPSDVSARAVGIAYDGAPIALVYESEVTGQLRMTGQDRWMDERFVHEGYSTLIHEFGHLTENWLCDDSERQQIKSWWISKMDRASGARWLDGREGYSTNNHHEAFAELFAHWAGARRFYKSWTQSDMNWLTENDSDMISLLEKKFGKSRPFSSIPLTPRFAVAAEERKYLSLGETLRGAEAAVTAARNLANLPAQERFAQVEAWRASGNSGDFLTHPLFLQTLEQQLRTKTSDPDYQELERRVHLAALNTLWGRDYGRYVLARLPGFMITELKNSGVVEQHVLGVYWINRLVDQESPLGVSVQIQGNREAKESILGDPETLDLLIRRLPEGADVELDGVFSDFIRDLHASGRWREYVRRMPPAVRNIFGRVSQAGGLLWREASGINPHQGVIDWFDAVGVAQQLVAACRTERESLLVNMKEWPPFLDPAGGETRDLFSSLPEAERWRLLMGLRDIANAEKVRHLNQKPRLLEILTLDEPQLNAFYDTDGLARRRLEETLSAPVYEKFVALAHVARKRVDAARTRLGLRSEEPDEARKAYKQPEDARKAYRSLVDAVVESLDLNPDDGVAAAIAAYRFTRRQMEILLPDAPGELVQEAYDRLAEMMGHRPEEGVFHAARLKQRMWPYVRSTGDPLKDILEGQVISEAGSLEELGAHLAEKGGALSARWQISNSQLERLGRQWVGGASRYASFGIHTVAIRRSGSTHLFEAPWAGSGPVYTVHTAVRGDRVVVLMDDGSTVAVSAEEFGHIIKRDLKAGRTKATAIVLAISRAGSSRIPRTVAALTGLLVYSTHHDVHVMHGSVTPDRSVSYVFGTEDDEFSFGDGWIETRPEAANLPGPQPGEEVDVAGGVRPPARSGSPMNDGELQAAAFRARADLQRLDHAEESNEPLWLRFVKAFRQRAYPDTPNDLDRRLDWTGEQLAPTAPWTAIGGWRDVTTGMKDGDKLGPGSMALVMGRTSQARIVRDGWAVPGGDERVWLYYHPSDSDPFWIELDLTCIPKRLDKTSAVYLRRNIDVLQARVLFINPAGRFVPGQQVHSNANVDHPGPRTAVAPISVPRDGVAISTLSEDHDAPNREPRETRLGNTDPHAPEYRVAEATAVEYGRVSAHGGAPEGTWQGPVPVRWEEGSGRFLLDTRAVVPVSQPGGGQGGGETQAGATAKLLHAVLKRENGSKVPVGLAPADPGQSVQDTTTALEFLTAVVGQPASEHLTPFTIALTLPGGSVINLCPPTN